jgi:hypothetical protein
VSVTEGEAVEVKDGVGLKVGVAVWLKVKEGVSVGVSVSLPKPTVGQTKKSANEGKKQPLFLSCLHATRLVQF